MAAAVMARPTSSRALYQQSAGRVLRTAIGKHDALILDMVGITSRHTIHTAASLIDAIPDGGDIRDDETATEAVQRMQEELVEYEHRTGRLIAIDVDIFHRSHLNWVPANSGLFMLTGAKQAFAVRLGASGSSCDLFRLEEAGYDYRVIPVAGGLTLEMAQSMAEDAARHSGFDATAMRDAAWRNHPATNAQRRKLWAMGLRNQKALAAIRTSGEASNMITLLMADKAIRMHDQGGEAAA